MGSIRFELFPNLFILDSGRFGCAPMCLMVLSNDDPTGMKKGLNSLVL